MLSSLMYIFVGFEIEKYKLFSFELSFSGHLGYLLFIFIDVKLEGDLVNIWKKSN